VRGNSPSAMASLIFFVFLAKLVETRVFNVNAVDLFNILTIFRATKLNI
jgi:hypothetical protein